MASKDNNQGQTTNNAASYDALNRRTLAEYGRGKQGNHLTPPDATVAYIRDAGDRLTQVTDSQDGTVTRGYDGLDRLASETTPQGSVAYGWDAAGRRATLTVAGQPQVAYGFDDGDRLTTITQGSSQVGIAYDNAGRRTTLTLPDGVNASYAYDNANQLTGITYRQGATVVGDLAYSYDAAGRRTQTSGSLARTNLPQALTSATYNAANRLTNWAGTAQTFDDNGNLTGDGAKTYTWDSRNRLTGLGGAASATFAYDGLGRRTGKTVSSTSTNFLYDGVNPVQELTGTTPTANLLTGLGLDEYFTRTDSAGPRSYLTDALGSTLALADGSGATQTSYTYAPYGETTASGETSGNALQYTGRENDGTGLYFYRARYYDPLKSRFASEDPIGLAGGINTYGYVNGNPISFTDPYGLFNYAKGAVAIGNVVIAGASIGGGAAAIVTGIGTSSTGAGIPVGAATIGFGAWRISAGIAAARRAKQQWKEAEKECSSDASWRNVLGLLPYGQNFDDPYESIDDYGRWLLNQPTSQKIINLLMYGPFDRK